MKTVKKVLLLALVTAMCVTLLAPAVFAKDTTKLPEKQTYGLDNLNNEAGNLYVAYLGGSITAGSGGGAGYTYKDNAGTGHSRWSSQLTKRYFQKEYPNKKVIEVNAGVGGTPSDLGLFRMHKDVVAPCGTEGPDVVFVEFAVNDMWTSLSNPNRVHQTMEGIVRQLAHLPKQPVVIFVYTAAWRDDTGFENYIKSAQVHQQVADYYGIGSINLCEYVAGGKDLNGNAIVWDKSKAGTWTGDNTHPNSDGYTAYTDYIMKQFKDSPKEYFKKLTWQEIPMSGYEFGKPNAVRFDQAGAVYTGTWATQTLVGTLGASTTTTTADATVTLKFKGRAYGVYAARGKNGADVQYRLDNSPPQSFGNYYNSGWMAVATLLKWDSQPGEHTITYTVKPSGEKTTFGFGYFFMDEETPDPIAYDVAIKAGNKEVSEAEVGQTLTGDYRFINSITEEEGTTWQWLFSDTKNGTYIVISTSKSLTPPANMAGKYIKFRVIPKNMEGTIGKTVETAPVRLVRPNARTSFSASNVVYYKGANAIGNLVDDTITAKTTVKNKLAIPMTISVITAEYQVTTGGQKMLLQVKKDTKTIAAMTSVDFANEMTVANKDGRMVQTMIMADDYLEPIGTIAQLLPGAGEKVVYIDTEKDGDTDVVSYQINRFVD